MRNRVWRVTNRHRELSACSSQPLFANPGMSLGHLTQRKVSRGLRALSLSDHFNYIRSICSPTIVAYVGHILSNIRRE